MRPESENWWKQAQKDLESAQRNLSVEEYYVVAFLSQQAVEKALKALYIERRRESPGSVHSLVFLGREVGVPERLWGSLRRLTPDFIVSRYPDAANGVPYEMYDEGIAKERLGIAREVLAWVGRELG